MAGHQGFSAVFCFIGSFVAARAALAMAAARTAILGDTVPVISSIVDGCPIAIDQPSVPYEGVARRKSPSSPTTCYLSTVLRPKP
jgi:hypothetical protein